jgi:soluble lytic murein transglycosylase-like protein
MTSTRQATPFHVFVLAGLVAAAGGIMQLNKSLPVSQYLSETFYSHVVPATGAADTAPDQAAAVAQPTEPKETLAQKRARYLPHVLAAALASKIEPALIEAVITAESAFNPMAVSRTGAVGLMQLMPDTAERFGVTDRWDPAQNILGGAKYLNFLLNKFGNKKLAIAAYNAGEGNVKKHRNKIPPFSETRAYVPRVLAYYTRYRSEA